jgi:integrase
MVNDSPYQPHQSKGACDLFLSYNSRDRAAVIRVRQLLDERNISTFFDRDARHSVATLLLEQRVPTKLVAARLGHADTGVTENIYSHVLKRMQATDDFERAILSGRKGSNKA